jgi:hypothetical protein
MDLNLCIKLAIKSLSLVAESLDTDRFEIGVIDVKTRMFRKLSVDELRKYIEEAKSEGLPQKPGA